MEKYAEESFITGIIESPATKIIDEVADEIFDVAKPIKSEKKGIDLMGTYDFMSMDTIMEDSSYE